MIFFPFSGIRAKQSKRMPLLMKDTKRFFRRKYKKDTLLYMFMKNTSLKQIIFHALNFADTYSHSYRQRNFIPFEVC